MWTPLGRPGCKVRDFRFDPVDYFLSIGAIANDYDTAHDFFAVLVENAAAEFRPQMDIRDIAHDRRVCLPSR